MAGNRTRPHAQAEAVLLQKRVAELQSRLDSERADAKAASAALQTAQGHVRSLEQAGDGLQKQRAAAEEQVQRLQKELADSKVQTPARKLFFCGYTQAHALLLVAPQLLRCAARSALSSSDRSPLSVQSADTSLMQCIACAEYRDCALHS